MARRSKDEAAAARRAVASIRQAVAGAGFTLRCVRRGEAYEVVKGRRGRKRVGMWRVPCEIVYLRPNAPKRLVAALTGCDAARVCQ